MTRLDQARQLVTDVQAALDASPLERVTATLDALKVHSAARHGIVVVSAPKLTFTQWGEIGAAFELQVIAGPADNYLAAWERIDQIIQALSDAGINLASGEPTGYQPAQGPTLPCYTLTLNDLD